MWIEEESFTSECIKFNTEQVKHFNISHYDVFKKQNGRMLPSDSWCFLSGAQC